MAMKPLDDDLEVVHDINVTPFIDVVLVLLIIFMVAAPLATVSVPVNLPAAASSEPPPVTKPLYLTLSLDHQLSLGDRPVPDGQLVSVLERATSGNHQQRIYIRADKGLAYGDLMALLAELQQANFTQIALVGMDKG